MNPELEADIYERAWKTRNECKQYARYWNWFDRGKKELGIIRDWLEAVEAVECDGGNHCLVEVHAFTPDPPDSVGKTEDRQLVAIEVTELVDEETVVHYERGQRDWKNWGPDELIAKLREIVNEKDAKEFHGGPYSKKILVIYTDEPVLRQSNCSQILRGQNFGPCRQINEVYLLFSPDPARGVCSFIRLET